MAARRFPVGAGRTAVTRRTHLQFDRTAANRENAERQRANDILKAASAFATELDPTRGRLGATEHGRGLLVVNRLSVNRGHRRDGDRGTVWAQVRRA
ncbi:hypothetical protein ACFFSW_35100 [Saccharothrix longispora]|uniref:Uncharacterized protein n=1 Tax=Saccharothrix longispora TaxID=33920 RepID=A0ABU1PRX5_9PSEU|nr:hypothetical protein [Saccharothrix longispora]MDR6593397.1 hypothetical protein [Saccharothrix longispora]